MTLLVGGVAEIEPSQEPVARDLGGTSEVAPAVGLGLRKDEELLRTPVRVGPDPAMDGAEHPIEALRRARRDGASPLVHRAATLPRLRPRGYGRSALGGAGICATIHRVDPAKKLAGWQDLLALPEGVKAEVVRGVGVASYWIADPAARTLETLRLDAATRRWVDAGAYDATGVARISPFEEIELDLARVFPPAPPEP